MTDPTTWQAERALLSGLMLEPGAVGAVGAVLAAEDFGDPDHALVYGEMLRLSEAGIQPDAAALLTGLNGNANSELILSLDATGSSAANSKHYAKAIKAGSIRRRLREIGARIAEDQSAVDPAALIESAVDELESLEQHGPRIETRPPERASLVPSDEEIAAASLGPRCIVDRYLYADVAQVVAPGSTGKTTLLLYEAAAIALGSPLHGLRVESPGWTLIITAEDARERLIARLREITTALELTETQRRHVFESVLFWDVTGSALKLAAIIDGNLILTRLADDVVKAYKTDPPAVVVFDPLVSFGASEQAVNDNEQALVTAARRIVRGLDCCVRYIHHTGKANARAATLDQYSGRGGSALADGSRMTAVLQRYDPEDENNRRPPQGCRPDPESSITILARAKLSYAPPNLPLIWVKRSGFAFESFVEMHVSPDEAAAARADQLERYLISQHTQGRYWTARQLEDANELGMTRRDLRAAITALQVSGRVIPAPLPRVMQQGGRKEYLCPSNCAEPSGAVPEETP